MKLLTKEVLKALPKLYSQEHNPDPIVVVKYFDPCSNWTWYIYEGEIRDGDYLMFGLVRGQEEELGYVSMTELAGVRNRFGLGIERDSSWRPTPLSKVKSGEVR